MFDKVLHCNATTTQLSEIPLFGLAFITLEIKLCIYLESYLHQKTNFGHIITVDVKWIIFFLFEEKMFYSQDIDFFCFW